MAQPCPELIFVAGPQQGQRAVLIKAVMVAGRASSCDVHVAEEYVSRQHLKFEMTPDGCVVECLSSKGIRINDRKYKPSQKVILDTGDSIAVGAQTVAVFVAAGDDPEVALASYRNAHPHPSPQQEEQPPPPVEEPLPAPEAPVPAEPAPAEAPSAEAAEQAAKSQQRKAKLRKYVVFGAVYAGVLVAVVIVLSSLKKQTTGPSGPPKNLLERELAEALREEIRRPLNPNIAAERLREALAAFDNRKFRYGNLQKCVKGFKLYLAYENKVDFDDAKISAMYQAARDELIDQVQANYKEACLREKAKWWERANESWETLRMILPSDAEWNSPGYTRLVKNIMDHAAYARQNMPKRR